MPATTKATLGQTLDNQRIMKLVEEALGRPEQEQREFLQRECVDNSGDFEQAWHYVEWERRMQGFLLEPVIKRDEGELHIAPDDVLQNRFRVVRELAQGGMGVVYEAVDEKLGRRIALKCAKAGFGRELPPEVRHATEVSHPNVCKIYEIHTTTIKQQMVDFITMEFLEGETLSARLQRVGSIPQGEATQIARQLAAGLAAAHQNGVIHGDIKSNNVFLTKAKDGTLRAVITDFGLARTKDSAARGIWGTPGYMAPELWLGEQPSVASDIYALGIVFYEMATGEIPDRSQTQQAKSQTLKATPWLEVARQKPPSVNSFWDRILARCLDPEPKKRFANADQLVTALEPGHSRRNLLLAAATVAAIALTGLITYKAATAPSEKVRLAVETDGGIPFPGLRETLERLTGTKKVGFSVVTSGRGDRATHLLKVSAVKKDAQIEVHAVLTDEQTQSQLEVWDGRYGAKEWKYVAGGLAGVVSAGLHLMPLPEATEVNEAASTSFQSGMRSLRQEWTVADALNNFEKARILDPDSPIVWAALAQARHDAKQGDTREAERQAELRYLDTAIGHRAIASLMADARFEELAAHLQRAIELEPENADNYRLLGEAYQKSSQFDLALRAEKRAVELEPKYYKNQLSLGELYSDQGRYREAVERLSEAVRLAPNLPEARFSLAEAYTDTGEFEQALANLNALPNWGANEHFQYGTILMYQRKDSEAVPHLLSAVRQNPEELVYWEQLSIAQRRAGDLTASQESLRRGLTLAEKQLILNPKRGDNRAFVGYFCAQLGQNDRAEYETAQALTLAPHQNDVLWLAIAAYKTMGRRDAALAILRGSAPPEMISDVKRWPDLADLAADSRFMK